MNIKKKELPLALLMFFYFFLVIVSFWILKPIKKAIFITFYDQTGFNLWGWQMEAAQAELLAKVMNMFVAIIAVVIFTWLVRRMQRQQLTLVFSVFFMVAYVIYSMVINNPTDVTVWTFHPRGCGFVLVWLLLLLLWPLQQAVLCLKTHPNTKLLH
jgi:ATP/ADP translocase